MRDYFDRTGAIEIEVPVLGACCVTDPYIESIGVNLKNRSYYLQSSPEYFIKRLLANFPQSMYYLGKAFRQDESGVKHNPEFTMLEWYRPGFNDRDLIEDVLSLFQSLKPNLPVTKKSYREIFYETFKYDPHRLNAEELEEIANHYLSFSFESTEKNIWLDLLFSHCIEPNMQAGITVVYDYPASQSALSKTQILSDGIEVAKRFEIFWDGIELANGYWELTDSKVQKKRFDEDNSTRLRLGLPQIEIDELLLDALEQGIPDCAGVALGMDRLLMCLYSENDIRNILPFNFNRLNKNT